MSKVGPAACWHHVLPCSVIRPMLDDSITASTIFQYFTASSAGSEKILKNQSLYAWYLSGSVEL